MVENYKYFDQIADSVSLICNENIVDESVMEGWLEQNYVYDKYATTKAVERYGSNLAVSKISENDIDVNTIQDIINERIKFLITANTNNYVGLLSLKVRELNKIRKNTDFEEYTAIDFVKQMDSVDNLVHMKSALHGYDKTKKYDLNDSATIELLRVLETLKYIIRTSSPISEEFKYTVNGIRRVLYLYKDFDCDYGELVVPYMNVDVCTNKLYTCNEIKKLFNKLEVLMENECDYLLDYMVETLHWILNMATTIEHDTNMVTESKSFSMDDIYDTCKDKFDNMTDELFGSDVEPCTKEVFEYFILLDELSKYEASLEASSRIITKGTDKVTRGIGNASAKSRGMGNAQSKKDQIKRGARIVDDRASGAVNRKIEQILNTSRDAKREKILTGKSTVKLGKALRSAITVIASSAAGYVVLGPVVGAATGIISIMAKHALSKNTEAREKKRIMLELETELKIVKEKIEDAKGDNSKEQKYQLMRIQANLEKEITRIKHGLRYY